MHSAIARSSPRAIGVRRNPAIAWPWLSDLPTSINSTSGPRWTTARDSPRLADEVVASLLPHPVSDMPATSLEPVVDQNGVCRANWTVAAPARARRPTCRPPPARPGARSGADDPPATRPAHRRRRRGRRRPPAGRPPGRSRPREARASSRRRRSRRPRRLPWARDLRHEPATLDPDDFAAMHLTSLGIAIAFSRRSVEWAWIGKSRSRSSRRAPRTSIPRAGTVAIDPLSPRSQRTAARAFATASRQAVDRSAG